MGLSGGETLRCDECSEMYLLNPKGEIIAMDLRGEELEQKVASFFN